VSHERRTQLICKSGPKLTLILKRMLKVSEIKNIDVELFWPPDLEAIEIMVRCGGHNPDQTLTIPVSHWRLPTDPVHRDPPDLYADIIFVCRAVWKDISKEVLDIRAYLRMHDSDYSVDLRNGRKIDDRDRPDLQKPARKTVAPQRRSTQKERPDGDLIRSGDPVDKISQIYKESGVTTPKHPGDHWSCPSRGIRWFVGGKKVTTTVYFKPFADSICGIWIGASAQEVEEVLGKARREFQMPQRLWQYEIQGSLSLIFNDKDRVTVIQR
jgi:hypothetical protein